MFNLKTRLKLMSASTSIMIICSKSCQHVIILARKRRGNKWRYSRILTDKMSNGRVTRGTGSNKGSQQSLILKTESPQIGHIKWQRLVEATFSKSSIGLKTSLTSLSSGAW